VVIALAGNTCIPQPQTTRNETLKRLRVLNLRCNSLLKDGPAAALGAGSGRSRTLPIGYQLSLTDEDRATASDGKEPSPAADRTDAFATLCGHSSTAEAGVPIVSALPAGWLRSYVHMAL
jgi:hypothetical protein